MWRRKRKIIIACLIIVLGFMGVLWFAFASAQHYFTAKIVMENERILRLATSGLQGSLQRYEPIPTLLAEKPDIISLIGNEQSLLLRAKVNEKLKQISEDIGASDIYVMDMSGETLAASNFDKELSFVGQNFSYRPYFVGAMSGKPTTYFALGTTSGIRGFYFASPVQLGERIAGVVAVKIGLQDIENNWQGSQTEIFTADNHGVVFMASRKDWLFKSLGPLPAEALEEIAQDKRYPVEKLSDLNFTVSDSGVDNSEILTINVDGSRVSYIENSSFMPVAGWTLYVLTPQEQARRAAYSFVGVTLLALLLLVLMTGFILNRRAQMIRNLQLQRKTQDELEFRVKERTDDLNQANKRLRQEVRERTQTEEQLRLTQRELVQAGKLAALGQMSAALSHELNQPLAAIKAYAENAIAYLNRDNVAQAGENIGHIALMADRMAELGGHLRNFARKPKNAIDTVDLRSILDVVQQIMSARVKNERATIHIDYPDEVLMVNGGQVRLQQVFVNLINNGLDAMKGKTNPGIDVIVTYNLDEVMVDVRDYGGGVVVQDVDRIFDPFFTTKGVNEGLGLGLSISYNIVQDFGGTLKVKNHPDGGAVFQLILKRTKLVDVAAQ